MSRISERLRPAVGENCWGQPFEYEADGSIACRVLEGTGLHVGQMQCPVCETMPWRKTPPGDYVESLMGDSNFKENGLSCVCEIPQAPSREALTACIESTERIPVVQGQPVNGWCYVEPAAHAGANEKLVAACPTDQKRTLRFVGDANPNAGSLTFVTCAARTF